MGVHFVKILTVYTLNSYLLTITKKVVCFRFSAEIFEASFTNSVDPDQTLSDLGPHCLPLNIY